MSSLTRMARAVVCLVLPWLTSCAPNSSAGAAFSALPSAGSGGAAAVSSAGGSATGGSLAAVMGGASASGGSAAQAGGAASFAGGPSSFGGAGAPSSEGGELLGSALAGELAEFDSAPHSLAPTGLWGKLQKPLPTNAWWENLVLGKGESPVMVLPYLVAASTEGLRVCFPRQVVEADYIFSVMADDLVLSSVEPLGQRAVQAHDALSVTLGWQAGGGSLAAPLVEGMAYVSARYTGIRPRLRTAHAVASVNGTTSAAVSGARLELALNNGQIWRIYSTQPLSWTWSGQQLEASGPLDGWLRVAVSPSPELGALLDEHADSVPTGGAVQAQATGNTAGLRFDWSTEGAGEPLMFALPHHLPTLKTPLEGAGLATLRGRMSAVVGKSWSLEEPLTPIAWTAARPISQQRRGALLAALKDDAEKLAPSSEEPYFFGKQLGAVARLALIADELGETALATELREKLAAWLEPWLAGGSASRLVYDETWGGLVSRPGIADAGADFGLGYYNDHHFQFGYFIYAAAVLAKGDPAWAARRRAALEVVLRDYASPKADAYFPAYRCKDWFVGHSWAAGVFEFADSRNQESTSEAVNGYYAVYLWGLATGDARLRDLGRLMLATEIRASQTYWQVKDTSIYPEPFAAHKIVGVLWATKADHTTWFGSQLEFIHGIQWMPFTPISEELLPSSWIAQTYPLVSSALSRSEPVMGESWRGLVHMAHAILDPDAAWAEVEGLTSFDDGNSRTNALYWVATR